MTKGELIAACIKSMYRNADNQLDPETISEQDEYFEITANVIECINRGLTRIYDAKKLPKKVFYITKDTEEILDLEIPKSEIYSRYDVSKIINDLGRIENISLENDQLEVYNANISYHVEGSNILVLPKLKHLKDHYIINYTPKVKRMAYYQPDTEELPYDDEIYDKLIYFVKSELYEEENANVAAYARNIFEQYLTEQDNDTVSVIRNVKDVYGMW